MSPTVLLVDDEELFLRTAVDGLAGSAPGMTVLTAKNGRLATEILAQHPVDLVVTDLKMPEMDGYGLLAYMTRKHPGIPAIVMTAFGTPDIEAQLNDRGVTCMLDKPFDFKRLQEAIEEVLSTTASGHLFGISLATFLQMIEIERKTCVVRVASSAGLGFLHFREGRLVHAQAGETSGEPAALEILAWSEPKIELLQVRTLHTVQTFPPLLPLIMEACRIRDESMKGGGGPSGADRRAQSSSGDREQTSRPPSSTSSFHKEAPMAASDKLKELAQIDGFSGCALFTPTGELLAIHSAEGVNLKEVGVLANQVLMNAQKASLEMGTGRGQQVHVEAENAHILVRCLNEGTDPLKSMPGKAHIHLVLILKSDASIGMAKLRLNSVIAGMAEYFRA